MNFPIQSSNYRFPFVGENYEEEERVILPSSRVTTLNDIVKMFSTGRPIDANLERHLDYNDIEDHPFYRKGIDLADLGKIAAEVGASTEQLEKEIEAAKLAQIDKKTLEGESPTPPEKVPTE